MKKITERKNRLRVCILTSSYPRFRGDPAGVFIENLVFSLTSIGLRVQVICPHHGGCVFREVSHDVIIKRFPYFFPFKWQRLCYGSGILSNLQGSILPRIQLPFFVLSEIIFGLFLTRHFRADLIHAHWSIPQGLIGILCKKLLKIPCVVSLHGSDVFGFDSGFKKWLNALVLQNCDICSANSRMTAERAKEFSRISHLPLIPMGVADRFFTNYRENAVKRKHFPVDANILYVGRLIDLKGIDFLVKALPFVLEKFPEAALTIVGSGPFEQELITLCKKLGVKSKVFFAEQVQPDDLPAIYASADVFVLPSIVNARGQTEGLGVVLLEAMASGIPVVASNVGGIPDIIKDGITGLLFPPKNSRLLAEKIELVLSDQILRQRLIENAQKWVATKFSWDTIADCFMAIYREAIYGNTNDYIGCRERSVSNSRR